MFIDVFLEENPDTVFLKGTNNAHAEDACGVRIQAKFSPDYVDEYRAFVAKPESVRLVPTEYYKVEWLGFSGNAVTQRSVPTTASVIDSTAIRLSAGVDHHLQQIVRTHLDPKERVELARQYRSLREEFADKEAVKEINKRLLAEDDLLTDRALSLGIDISQGYAWEAGLAAHIDGHPFYFSGRGEQNTLKTLLALGRNAGAAEIVLIEEPETHLSHTSLRRLISRIGERCVGKQVVVATHSAYVLNKLGLDNLVLLGEGIATRLTDLPKDTTDYFRKLAGFDTLRLVLARGAILVEGPSDELVLQRAYLDVRGKLPIEDGIDVISVGMAHKRFLDLALRLKRRVWVVVDNDGKTKAQVEARFVNYLGQAEVSLHVGEDPLLRTLELQIVAANGLDTLNAVLGLACGTSDEVCTTMLADKTAAALAIFDSPTSLRMPEYIREVCGG